MRTTLSIEGVRQNENGIVNLDNAWYALDSVCEKRESCHVLSQFRQSSTIEGT